MTESTPTPTGSPAPRRRIWLRVLLFVSLALNLAVAGIVAGAMLKMSRDDDRPERIAGELGLGPFLIALDEPNRKALWDSAQARRGELSDGRREWRSALTESLALLRETPFDEARFIELVNRQAEIASRGRMIGQQELARRLSEMSPEARAAFADRLERGWKVRERFRDPGRRRHDGPPENRR